MMLTDATFSWTKHAKGRRREMGLTEDQVEAAIRYPEMSYPATGRYAGQGVYLYQRGGVVAIAQPKSEEGCYVIITIIWHRAEGRAI